MNKNTNNILLDLYLYMDMGNPTSSLGDLHNVQKAASQPKEFLFKKRKQELSLQK